MELGNKKQISSHAIARVGSVDMLSPRLFMPTESFVYKAVSTATPISENNIVRSSSFTNIESEQRAKLNSDKYYDTLQTIIVNLTREIEVLKADNQRLTELDQTRKGWIEELTNDSKELNNQVRMLKEELEIKNQKLQRHIQDNAELSQEISDVKKRQIRANNAYDAQIEDLNKDLSAMRHEMSSVKAEKQEFLEQIKEQRTMSMQLNQLIVCLKNQIEASEKEKKILNDSLSRLTQSNHFLHDRVADLTLENEKLSKLLYDANDGDRTVLKSTIEINEIGRNEEKVFWKRMIKSLKVSAKETETKKGNRLSGRLKPKKK